MNNMTDKQLRHIVADYLDNDIFEYCSGRARIGDKFSAAGAICQIITNNQWFEQDKLYKSPKWLYTDNILNLNQTWRIPLENYKELIIFKNSFIWSPGKENQMSFQCISDLLGKRPGWNIIADYLRRLN